MNDPTNLAIEAAPTTRRLARRRAVSGEVHRAAFASVVAARATDGDDLTLRRALRESEERHVTELKKAEASCDAMEAQLREAQKMDAIGRLAGGIAHDFNNLMAVTLLNCEMLLDEMGAHDTRRADVEEIRTASQRATALTRQLLAVSSRQVLQPRLVDLNEIVADTSRMLRRAIGEDIEMSVELASDRLGICVDPGQLEQVLMNLVLNARDAMPMGGRMVIETSEVEIDEEFVRLHEGMRTGYHALLSVSDTGSGMDPETRSQIFEPFFTTKGPGKGTGLGLSTSYGIVKQSGGKICVSSEPGHGSVFAIYLPLVAGQLDETCSVPSSGQPSARGVETVLLVEDDAMVRSAITKALRAAGYTVLMASRGEEAIAHAHASGPVDLLLTDVVVPGMSGRDIAARVLERRPGVAVLYMSGFSDHAAVADGAPEVAAALIQKPFTTAALTARMRQVLGARGAA